MSNANNEQEEYGISIGDICRTIFSQKIVALIVAVALFFLCTAVLYFGYSASNTNYSVTFTLTLLNADSNSTYYSLPDGTVFYYSDYVSQGVLGDVVESNSDALGYVNYTKMSQKNDISLTKTTSSDENSSVLTISSGDIFTITVKGSYFNSSDDATLFLTTLAQYPITSYISANASADYTGYLSYSDFENALTFADQISYINTQISYIRGLYSNISSSTTAGVSSTVAATLSNFNAWVARLDIDSYSSEIETYYYCKDYESTLEKYENLLIKTNGLYDQYYDAVDYYNLLLTSLSGSTATSSSIVDTLSSAISQINSLKQQIKLYENYISAYYETETDATTGFLVLDDQTGRVKVGNLKSAHIEETETFAKELDDIFIALTVDNEYIAKYVELNELVCNDVSSVNYADSSKAISSAPLGLAVCLVISLVVAIIVACIVAYVVASIKKSKAQNGMGNEEKSSADKE